MTLQGLLCEAPEMGIFQYPLPRYQYAKAAKIRILQLFAPHNCTPRSHIVVSYLQHARVQCVRYNWTTFIAILRNIFRNP